MKTRGRTGPAVGRPHALIVELSDVVRWWRVFVLECSFLHHALRFEPSLSLINDRLRKGWFVSCNSLAFRRFCAPQRCGRGVPTRAPNPP